MINLLMFDHKRGKEEKGNRERKDRERDKERLFYAKILNVWL